MEPLIAALVAVVSLLGGSHHLMLRNLQRQMDDCVKDRRLLWRALHKSGIQIPIDGEDDGE